MGSIEMAALNGSRKKRILELWRGDGIKCTTTAAIAKGLGGSAQLGYDAYKQKLIAEGRYQEQSGGRHRARAGVAGGTPSWNLTYTGPT